MEEWLFFIPCSKSWRIYEAILRLWRHCLERFFSQLKVIINLKFGQQPCKYQQRPQFLASKWQKGNGKYCGGSYHKYLICFFKEHRKKSVAAISPGIPITITNTNHKLTTSMKATKATNIQIRLLVEESQQLNSRKWKTRKKHKLSENKMIPISNYIQKQNKDLNATN